jgi:hypothetical protein
MWAIFGNHSLFPAGTLSKVCFVLQIFLHIENANELSKTSAAKK